MSITILITSDLHGRLDRFQQLSSQMADLNPHLVIDNGDFLEGSPSTFYYKHISNKVNPMIELANELYDVAVFGNHEFQKDLASMEELLNQFQFPWISCNISGFSKPYYIKAIHGKKFAVLGATTHYTSVWDDHQYLRDLAFENALGSIQYWVDFIQANENPDYLILSYHGGFTEDPETGVQFQDRTGENQGNEILETIKGIDLFISGHQHLLLNTYLDETLIVQPASHGKGFFEVQVDFENNHSQAIFHPIDASPVSYPPEVEEWLNETIANMVEDYTYGSLLASRLSSHPYIQLLHDMQFKMTHAQISVCDLFFLEKGGFKGEVTNRDLLMNAAREHSLKVVVLTGNEIKQLMERSAAIFAVNDSGEVDFATNVYPDVPQPYEYDFWGGISYVIDLAKPIGHRVQDVQYRGARLADDHPYTVAFNSYRLTGYDFPLLKNRPIVYETQKTFPFLLKEYLTSHMPSTVPKHGEFQVILSSGI